MDHSLVVTLALIGVLGIGSQWVAWRLHVPAIVLLAVSGLLAGPVLGLIDPAKEFGPLLRGMIAVAVAIVLFEGGLNLKFREIVETSTAVRRLVVVGVPLSWALGTFACHLVAGLSWPVAILFAGILVVTGPTVIIPLLRQAKLAARPAAILRWEGIVNDPVGALLAVLVFEYLTVARAGGTIAETVVSLVLSAALAVALGLGFGRVLTIALRRGLVPEYLKASVILSAVLACYVSADLVHEETGLLAVTVLGMTLANAPIASIDEIRRFKENVSVVLVSGLFIVLSASLTADVLTVVDWRMAAFVAVVLFVVRPATVWISTIRAELSWRERTLIGWIAPRGIVAVAVSGVFGPALADLGYADGELLVPLAFAIVFATVIAHGFSIGPLARRLDLAVTGRPGVLIVGASPWSVDLARVLHDLDVPVMVCDANWHWLRGARLAGIDTYYGEVLSEDAEYDLDLHRFGHLLAVGDNDAYNALVCTRLAAEIGRHRVFQLGPPAEGNDDPKALAPTARGRPLMPSGADYDILMRRHFEGWVFTRTRLTETYDLDRYLAERAAGSELLFALPPSGEPVFRDAEGELVAGPGDTVVGFAMPASSNRGRPLRSPPG